MQASRDWRSQEEQSNPAGSVPLKRAASAHEDDVKTKLTRGRTGCLNCRRRRKKCDEAKPHCTKCKSRGEKCKWDTGITFRWKGLDPQHPSMLQSKTPKQSPLGFKIIDVRFQSDSSGPSGEASKSQETHLPRKDTSLHPSSSFRDGSATFVASRPIPPPDVDGAARLRGLSQPSLSCSGLEECSMSDATSTSFDGSAGPKCQPFPHAQANPVDVIAKEPVAEKTTGPIRDDDVQMIDHPRPSSDGSTSIPSGPWSDEVSASSATSTSSRSNKVDPTNDEIHDIEDGLTDLDSLDFLVKYKSAGHSSDSFEINFSTTSASHKSRAQLCKDIRDTLQTVKQSNTGSNPRDSAYALQDLNLGGCYRSHSIRLLHTPLTARPLGCTKLVKRRQLELWRNFIDKIAPWLDVCGTKKYFQQSLPLMAKSADHLHYAVLALSARHIELRTPGSLFSESTGLYQDAVQLLSSELHSLETTAVASCVMLCVLELMSSPVHAVPSLQACASLMDAAEMNTRSSGMRQALFWTFANMSLFSSTLGLQPESLPIGQFCSVDSFSTAVSYVRSLTWGEAYAKYAIFLESAVDSVTTLPVTAESPTITAQWNALFELIEDWLNCRPEEMQPLMSYPSILDDSRHPFPMLLYGSASAVLGNLLYHSASIVLQQKKPGNVELPRTQKSILWHARQICGIVAENQHHGSGVSGIRPLWIGGRCLGDADEHQSILDILARIERSTGWRTSWYTETLKQYWAKAQPTESSAE